MGTVGLSFGSPTSGAGFDVSTTVSEIVSNLQNVETPWKSQLTTLESQDTAISSLGTLFSNLSNDISSLTDLQGILAQKTGSSSNTNVLELTAASSSAIAGTHSVTVNSLAQTSSGYLNEIANASDTLSGSMTLKVGSGAAQTIMLDSADDTLSGLAKAINSSSVGITASVLTDASGSRLSLVSGVSGAGGDITVSNNSIAAAASNTLSALVTAGSGSTASTALLSAVASSSEQLNSTGSLNVTVGSGSQQSITMSAVSAAEGGTTLTDLENYINTPPAGTSFGFGASIVNNSDGTVSLQLTSGTPGSTGTLAVSSSISDPKTSLAYNATVTGANASLSVDGVSLTSASNTVANLIPGVTFQLLAPSSTPVQVVIGNDNAEVESTVNQFVSDYNSAISALNTQEGVTSSGTAEPLFGSPTLSLLQQQLLSGLNLQSPNGYLDAVSAAGTTLSGSMTIAAGGSSKTIVIGAAPASPAANTIYTGSGSDANTLVGLAAAINTPPTSLTYADTGMSASNFDTGAVGAVANVGDSLSGSMSITVGGGTEQSISMSDVDAAEGGTTLTDLEDYINTNSATLGVSASIVTNSNGSSSLSLTSGTSGTAGTLTVTSGFMDGIPATAAVTTTGGESTLTLISSTSSEALSVTSSLTSSTPAALSYTDSRTTTSTTPASGTLTTIKNSGDALGGSITVGLGGGAAQTNTVGASDNTLSGLMGAINSASLGVTASLDSTGTVLTLTSATPGSAGALNVTSNLYDSSNSTSTNLDYNNSSDINSLTSLGISVNNDGSLTFDANSLDSVLNTDYSGVVGFFQNVDSWGQDFSAMLTNAGTSSSTGILALASSSNSNIESTLNAEISKEQTYISEQQSSLTAELNSANEIMQQLPSQLQGVNELYSAITGYDQNPGG